MHRIAHRGAVIDGSARKCTSGDTVVLPKGWAGEWNIIEPVRKVWVEW